MITLTTSGNTIYFQFEDNPHYLQNGVIETPKNSLILVTDDSQMATFKKIDGDVFLSALYSELGMTKAELETWFEENATTNYGGGGGGGGDVTSAQVQTMIDASISGKADAVSAVYSAEYVESSTTIDFKNIDGTVISSIDASDFIVDGMVDDVRIETISGVSYLVIDFNTASGKEDIQIPLTDIFDPSNYYTKAEVDAALSGKADSSAVTAEIAAAVSGKVDTSTFNIYSAATYDRTAQLIFNVEALQHDKQDKLTAGSGITISNNVISATPTDLSNYYTKAEVDSAISAATDDMATQTWVGNQGYITGVDLSDYATLQNVDEAVSGKADSSSLATVATSGDYDDLLNKPTIPTVPTDVSAFNNDAGYITEDAISGKADTSAVTAVNDVLTGHTADTTIHVTTAQTASWDAKSNFSGSYNDLTDKPTIPVVPTSNTAFTNDAGYITEDAISGKADTSAVTAVNNVLTAHTADTTIHVTSNDKSTWSGKQDALVSGTNIKTINNQSLLGSGNITISGGSGSGTAAVEVTQAEYDSLVSGGTVDPTVFYIITDAPAIEASGFVQTSAITSAITSASTSSQIPTAKAVYDAIPTGGTGGGKAISAGTNISVTTGETADTINCTLPISNGSNNSLILGTGNGNTASGQYGIAVGGKNNSSSKYCSLVGGNENNVSNEFETAFGNSNITNHTSDTFGDSGNTLFSVGNGSNYLFRHNAFEIRQNGDIYITSGGTDIKLQDNLGGGSVTTTSAVTSGSTDVITSGGVYDQLDGLKLKKVTQAEYDALVSGGTVDSSTVYLITNVVS